MDSVTIEDVRLAARRIGPGVQRTPVMGSRTFNKLTGRQVYFKCENLQYGGAFKIRGAANMMLALGEEQLRNGVVAYSSGNHAQAVAIAAGYLGVPATIVMPDDAPRSKVAATRGYGAKVVMYDRLKEDRVAIGSRIAGESGAAIVPPFDHPMIAAGQGTAALELLEEVPGLSALVVCIGGGGLISGCAVAAHGVNPGIRVFGVEPELANDTYLSMQQGHPVKIAPPDTIADGLRSQAPGEITFPLIRSHVEQVLLVSEDEIREMMRFFLTRMKIVVEPSGAVAAAAVMHNRLPAVDGPIGVVISGGNVDLEMLAGLL
jgi:threonine dehydratase